MSGRGIRSFWQIPSVLTSRFFPVVRRVCTALFCISALTCSAAEPEQLLLDLTSGQVLSSNKADEPIDVGALSRIPILYAALALSEEKGLTLADAVTVPAPGIASLRLKAKESVSLELLMSAYWITGKDDIEAALKTILAGDAAAFDQRAGAIVPDFVNGQMSLTAVAFWSQKLILEYPEVRLWSAAREIDYRGRHWRNPQALLRSSQSIVGLMAGEAADKWAGVTLSENPLGNGRKRRLLAVVAGAPSQSDLTDLSADLTQTGLRAYETLRVYKKGDVVAKVPVLRGAAREVAVVLPEDVYATLARESLADAKPVLRYTHPSPIVAPVTKGEPLGTITLLINDTEVLTVPVVSADAVAPGGFWRRLVDTFELLWLKPDESAS